MEAFSQLQIAQDLGYLQQENIDKIRPQFIHVAKMLSGLKNYFDNKPNPITHEIAQAVHNP